jgi:hypothetical protein
MCNSVVGQFEFARLRALRALASGKLRTSLVGLLRGNV